MKRRILTPAGVLAGVILALAFVFPGGVLADAGGDANAGDVWVDTAGAPPGPGHEMDPHLPCQSINLWGDKLADSGGTYTIDGWPPSGNKQQAYSSTWSYDQSSGGSQVISVIDFQALIQQAAANGDTPANNGYHFKLEFSQDPQKHKTFWVDCPPPSQQGTQQGTQGTPTQGTAPQNASGTSPGQAAPRSMVLGERVSGGTHRRHRAHRRHRKHHKVRKQAVLPAFAG